MLNSFFRLEEARQEVGETAKMIVPNTHDQDQGKSKTRFSQFNSNLVEKL